ncbi:C45 family peptidase [Bacteriovoracaceae bacterium]|nr:C45 family peptidase [Bacteriovoracaceae bacterium]
MQSKLFVFISLFVFNLSLFGIEVVKTTESYSAENFNCTKYEKEITRPRNARKILVEEQRCEIKSLFKPGEWKKHTFLTLDAEDIGDIQFAHGYLMAEQIADGSLIEALENIKASTASMKGIKKNVFKSIRKCIFRGLRKSVSARFNRAITGLSEGFQARLENDPNLKVKFRTHREFQEATLSIELGNVAYGLLHGMDEKWLKHFGKTLVGCGIPITKGLAKSLLHTIGTKGGLKEKFACSGVISNKNISKNGEFIHARNLEQTAMMRSWNKHPVTFLIKEKKIKNKVAYRDTTKPTGYVAYGTAGLVFPGGISGYNDQGITVSLHQLNARTYDRRTKKKKGDMLPMLQQEILAMAGSIDDAVQVAVRTKVFSSWIILIGDAKNNESATIEVSPKGVVVSQRSTEKSLGISNHFLSKSQDKHHFHSRYSNYMETQSRFYQINQFLKGAESTKNIDEKSLIQFLASHQDGYVNKEFIFGTSLGRTSNIFTSIAMPASEKSVLSLGDTSIANHGTYFTVYSDIKNSSFRLDNAIHIRSEKGSLIPNKAADLYGKAYLAHNGGRDDIALDLLEKINLIFEQQTQQGSRSYHDSHLDYLLGRFYLAKKDLKKAYEYLSRAQGSFTDEYRKKRNQIYLLYLSQKFNYNIGFNLSQFNSIYAETEAFFKGLLKNGYHQNLTKINSKLSSSKNIHAHLDIEAKLDLLKQIKKNKIKDFKKSFGKIDMSSID